MSEHLHDHVSDPSRDDSEDNDWATEGGALAEGPATDPDETPDDDEDETPEDDA